MFHVCVVFDVSGVVDVVIVIEKIIDCIQIYTFPAHGNTLLHWATEIPASRKIRNSINDNIAQPMCHLLVVDLAKGRTIEPTRLNVWHKLNSNRALSDQLYDHVRIKSLSISSSNRALSHRTTHTRLIVIHVAESAPVNYNNSIEMRAR